MSAGADHPGVIALPPVMYGVAFAFVLALRWLWPAPVAAPALAFWSGIAVLVAGGALALWGQRTMRRAGTNVNPREPATALVTGGPFRWSRNPLYVALTLLYLGLTLAVNTLWGFAVLAPLLALMHVGVVRREERYLEAKFGDDYRRYRDRVRRYL